MTGMSALTTSAQNGSNSGRPMEREPPKRLGTGAGRTRKVFMPRSRAQWNSLIASSTRGRQMTGVAKILSS